MVRLKLVTSLAVISVMSSCAALFGESEVALAKLDPDNPANLTVNSAPWVASFLSDTAPLSPTAGNFSESLVDPPLTNYSVNLSRSGLDLVPGKLSAKRQFILPVISSPTAAPDATDAKLKISVQILKKDQSLTINCDSGVGVFAKSRDCATEKFFLERKDISEATVLIQAKAGTAPTTALYEKSIQASRLEITALANTAGDHAGDDVDEMVAFGDDLCFVAENSQMARKVYCYSDSQLLQISDTAHGSAADDAPYGLVAYNDKLYFTAFNEYGAYKMYSFDRTQVALASNTRADLEASDQVESPFLFKDGLYFYALDIDTNLALYRVTSAGLEKIVINEPDFVVSDEARPVVAGDAFYATAYINGYAKFVSFDGSRFQIVVDLGGPTRSDSLRWMQALGDHLYFVLSSWNKPGKLYLVQDNQVAQISSAGGIGHDDFPIPNVAEYQNKVYFTAYNGSAYKIYQYDGKESSIAFHTRGNESSSDDPTEMLAAEGNLYIVAKNSSGAYKLFSYTTSPVPQLKVVADTRGDLTADDAPMGLLSYNKRIYFVANSAQSTRTCDGYGELCAQKLYLYDPQTSSASQVSNSAENRYRGDAPQQMLLHENDIYLTLKNSFEAKKLYRLRDLSAK